MKALIFHGVRSWRPLGAMSCEVKLNTLEGGVITLDVQTTATVRELKSMLLEKHPCEEPIERKLLKVVLLQDGSFIDDAETLAEAGLLDAESLVTVTYTRNVVEAGTKDGIHTQGFFELKIPSDLTEICYDAFCGCEQVVLVTIPESVTSIGGCAFNYCSSLEKVTIGDSVTHIGKHAFADCSSLASITMGEAVIDIGQHAFEYCTSLERINMGESVTHIQEGAFSHCSSLASVTMGESVTYICDFAFG